MSMHYTICHNITPITRNITQFCRYIEPFLSIHYNCMSRCYINNIDALLQLCRSFIPFMSIITPIMLIHYDNYVNVLHQTMSINYMNYVEISHQLCRSITLTPIILMCCYKYVDPLFQLCRCITPIISMYYTNYVDVLC